MRGAKGTNLDFIGPGQGAHDTVEDRFYGELGIFPGQLEHSRDLFNQIGFGHRPTFSICQISSA
jgi:hypothetical protein